MILQACPDSGLFQRVRVQSDEVHFHFRHLVQVQLVRVQVPPIRTFGEIMEGLPAQMTSFVTVPATRMVVWHEPEFLSGVRWD